LFEECDIVFVGFVRHVFKLHHNMTYASSWICVYFLYDFESILSFVGIFLMDSSVFFFVRILALCVFWLWLCAQISFMCILVMAFCGFLWNFLLVGVSYTISKSCRSWRMHDNFTYTTSFKDWCISFIFDRCCLQ